MEISQRSKETVWDLFNKSRGRYLEVANISGFIIRFVLNLSDMRHEGWAGKGDDGGATMA